MRAMVLLGLIACASPQRQRHPTTVYEHHRYYLNYVPFGAGQFQNDEPGKGIGFAVGEGVTAATSLGLWIYLESKYGDRNVSAGDASAVRGMQELEIATAIAWFGLVGWGIIDSLVNYQPYVRVDDGAAAVGLAWHR